MAGGADAQEGVGRGSAVPPDAGEAAPLVPSGAAGRMQRSNTSRDLGEGYDELREAPPSAPIGRLNLSAEPEDITDSYGPGASCAPAHFRPRQFLADFDGRTSGSGVFKGGVADMGGGDLGGGHLGGGGGLGLETLSSSSSPQPASPFLLLCLNLLGDE